jgi:hypothetical protein
VSPGNQDGTSGPLAWDDEEGQCNQKPHYCEQCKAVFWSRGGTKNTRCAKGHSCGCDVNQPEGCAGNKATESARERFERMQAELEAEREADAVWAVNEAARLKLELEPSKAPRSATVYFGVTIKRSSSSKEPRPRPFQASLGKYERDDYHCIGAFLSPQDAALAVAIVKDKQKQTAARGAGSSRQHGMQ